MALSRKTRAVWFVVWVALGIALFYAIKANQAPEFDILPATLPETTGR